MKPKLLTLETINNLDEDSILYAEFSAPGAMGACGTARIFALDDGILQFYLVSVLSGKNEKQKEYLNKVYGATYDLLRTLAKKKVLVEKYAGFGNTAWKRRNVVFTRDDDHSTFIYKKSKQFYRIPASNPGVYHKTVADFAERQVPINVIKKFYTARKKHLSMPEQDFFEAYLNQLEENDHRYGIFQFTVSEYWDTVQLLRYRSLQEFNLPREYIRKGEKALARYKLKYVLDTLGWNQLDEFFADFTKKGKTGLFESLNTKLSYRIETIYNQVKIKKSNDCAIDALASNSLDRFLDKPELVVFSEKAKDKIIETVLAEDNASLRADARAIAFFLANFCFLEDIPYSKVLPVAHYIVCNLPFDDFNHTQTDQLFWLAGEIINRAWRFVDSDERTQKGISDYVFSAYGSRVGSLWPIVNYGGIEYKDKAGQRMFSDSIGFIMSIDDITERIPGLESYLNQVAKDNYHAHNSVLNFAKNLVREKLPPEEALEHILSHENQDQFSSTLAHPSSIGETEVLLDKLIDGDERFDSYSRVAILENLLLNNTYSESRIVIAKYLNDHFREFTSLLAADAKAANASPSEFLTSIFTAARSGVLRMIFSISSKSL